jgi:predicted phage tail protein
MVTSIETKEEAIKRFLANIAKLRQLLKAAEETARAGETDQIRREIEQYRYEIADYERVVTALEKLIRDA